MNSKFEKLKVRYGFFLVYQDTYNYKQLINIITTYNIIYLYALRFLQFILTFMDQPRPSTIVNLMTGSTKVNTLPPS